MGTVTSKDGTTIAFDKVGSGPAVILVNGAMAYRAFDPTLGQLAEQLGKDFTVYNYDRRGRGESTDTKPFAKVREIEDIQALVDDAGGQAMLFGVSSGGALALEAAAAIPAISKLVVYEVPFIVDDSRSPVEDYEGHSTKLVEAGKLDELMNEYIPRVFGMLEEDPSETKQQEVMTEQAQAAPAGEAGANQNQTDMMKAMYAVLPTIPYDAAFVGAFMRGKPLSAEYWSKVHIPVLVGDGGASPAWLHNAADALGKALPHASRHTFAGQTHMFAPAVLAPVLRAFYKQ